MTAPAPARAALALAALALAALLAVLPAGAARAQFATLVADSVRVDAAGRLVAEGNVEILQAGRRVLADRIVYDQSANRVSVEGDVVVLEAATGAVLTGRAAELDRDFDEGLIRGARFLLDDQLQVAAAELTRAGGRYTRLDKAVASTCRVCGGGTPLWQIRARKIVHDQEARQLYFDSAVFQIGGVPLMYFPRLRMPDPSLRRASGFLIPQLRNSSTLGPGLKIPYFVTMGDHADLRLTPHIASRTRTLEARLRREFRAGSLIVDGAVSRDDLTDKSLRNYVFANGRFDLPADFTLEADMRLASDPSYLLTYDYFDLDRLPNRAEVSRSRRDEHVSASVEKLRSLRASEAPIEDTLASLLGRAAYERRLFPGRVGGEVHLAFSLEGHERAARAVGEDLADACAAAGVARADCLSRDVVHLGAAATWRRGWILPRGIEASAEGRLAADVYRIYQDADFAEVVTHATPTAAIGLRWPHARITAGGRREVVEPVAQLAWTDALGAEAPNEDSQLVEFDEGNLLALSRFPGSDRQERGWRTSLGVNWSLLAANGREYNVTVGRVFRLRDLRQFTAASGLDGNASDWLVAAQAREGKLTLTNRSLFDDGLLFSKSETQLAWQSELVTARGSLTWVVDDPAESRTGNTYELNFDADYRFHANWSANLSGRYDGNSRKATEAGIGLSYSNECLNVDFSVSRRFTTSTNVSESTDYGLSVSLNGFGRDGRIFSRSCHAR